MAEDIGTPFRSMSNPNTYGDPDTYLGTNWYTGTGDNGGVHTNSSVQNHWYYRLSQGGAGTNDVGNAFNVTGITRHKATQIAWRNDVTYLTSTADYADARFYAIQSANDLFGVCSPEAISTTKAWYAVGVGPDFVYRARCSITKIPVVSDRFRSFIRECYCRVRIFNGGLRICIHLRHRILSNIIFF